VSRLSRFRRGKSANKAYDAHADAVRGKQHCRCPIVDGKGTGRGSADICGGRFDSDSESGFDSVLAGKRPIYRARFESYASSDPHVARNSTLGLKNYLPDAPSQPHDTLPLAGVKLTGRLKIPAE
jgi:hypothetical protein